MSSVGAKRSRNQSDEDDYQPSAYSENNSDSDWQPKKKKRKTSKKVVSKKKSKKSNPKKSEKLTKKTVSEIKKDLNARVRTLAKMVNLDWHDGYEEQTEELCEYYKALKKPCQIIYDYCINKKMDYNNVNEIIKIIADTWANIHAIPFRCDCDESITDADGHEFDFELKKINKTISFGNQPKNIYSFMWWLLIYSSSSNENIKNDEIYRYIKDANDYNVNILNGYNNYIDINEDDNDDNEDDDIKKDENEFIQLFGFNNERVKELVNNKNIWNALSTTKKTHKMRRAIDRRFDGELHLRTRDYHLYDNMGF